MNADDIMLKKRREKKEAGEKLHEPM